MNNILFIYELNNKQWIDVELSLNKHYKITKNGIPFSIPEDEQQDFTEVCNTLISIERTIQ